MPAANAGYRRMRALQAAMRDRRRRTASQNLLLLGALAGWVAGVEG